MSPRRKKSGKRRPKRRLRGILKLYRYIPTSLTIGNSLCGFGAILVALQVYRPQDTDPTQLLATGAWLIVGAMIFDMLDGWAARMLNAYSLHGMHMDSLADMVTFGVAPAVIVAVMAHVSILDWLPYRLVWILCAVYLACAALRLALYNVMATQKNIRDADRRDRAMAVAEETTDPGDETDFGDDDEAIQEDSGGFHGLPSPGAAAGVCSVLILLGQDYSEATAVTELSYQILAELMPIYACLLGFLMVSPIPYMHIGHWLGGRRYYKLKILLVILLAIAFAYNKHLVAAILINAYILSGPIRALVVWIRGHVGPAADDHDLPTPA
jgi:CDP-diacylglycerol--serine O-phosphatidyltransferase